MCLSPNHQPANVNLDTNVSNSEIHASPDYEPQATDSNFGITEQKFVRILQLSKYNCRDPVRVIDSDEINNVELVIDVKGHRNVLKGRYRSSPSTCVSWQMLSETGGGPWLTRLFPRRGHHLHQKT